ncbi:hypothetical protein Tco_0838686 [Tanacetum coccineum]|uniref:Uncharacterized protein n=1 Tax=Tanacetum coccineum TaxID=301880 RepID=A0ABQ5ATH3_9ASTR
MDHDSMDQVVTLWKRCVKAMPTNKIKRTKGRESLIDRPNNQKLLESEDYEILLSTDKNVSNGPEVKAKDALLQHPFIVTNAVELEVLTYHQAKGHQTMRIVEIKRGDDNWLYNTGDGLSRVGLLEVLSHSELSISFEIAIRDIADTFNREVKAVDGTIPATPYHKLTRFLDIGVCIDFVVVSPGIMPHGLSRHKNADIPDDDWFCPKSQKLHLVDLAGRKKTGANGTRKVGVIQEFMNDALDSALDSDDMEDEIDEELDRVLIATFDSDDSYLGELWVLLEFSSVKSKEAFRDNVGVSSWFSEIRQASFDINPDGRIVGIELKVYSIEPHMDFEHSKIVTGWGNITTLMTLMWKLFPLETKYDVHIRQSQIFIENFKIIFRWKSVFGFVLRSPWLTPDLVEDPDEEE